MEKVTTKSFLPESKNYQVTEDFVSMETSKQISTSEQYTALGIERNF
jgi:hypothetical protein